MGDTLNSIDPVLLVLVGAFLSPILSVIMSQSWTPQLKSLFTLGVVVVTGVILAWWMDVLNRDGILIAISGVYTLVQVTYKSLWEPTGTSEKLLKDVGVK